MGRHHSPKPPAPLQAKTAAISQARQIASQVHQSPSAFSFLNSRQADSIDLSIDIDDDALTSCDESEGNDSVTRFAGASASVDGNYILPDRSAPLSLASSQRPFLGHVAGPRPDCSHPDLKVIGSCTDTRESHPIPPAFDNLALASADVFDGKSTSISPTGVHDAGAFQTPFGLHRVQAQNSHSILPACSPLKSHMASSSRRRQKTFPILNISSQIPLPLSHVQQQQERHDNVIALERMDVAASGGKPTAFLDDVFIDLRPRSPLPICLPIDVDMGPPPDQEPLIPQPCNTENSVVECVPMDTSPSFCVPSVTVAVDDVDDKRDMNMDVDAKPLPLSENKFFKIVIPAVADGSLRKSRIGHALTQSESIIAVPCAGGAKAEFVPSPPEDVSMEIVQDNPKSRISHYRKSSDAMAVDEEAGSSCPLALGSTSRLAVDDVAVAVPTVKRSRSTASDFPGQSYLQSRRVIPRTQARPQMNSSPEDVAIVTKAKPQLLIGSSRPHGEAGKNKSQQRTDEDKENAVESSIGKSESNAVKIQRVALRTTNGPLAKTQSKAAANEFLRGSSDFAHEDPIRPAKACFQPSEDKGKISISMDPILTSTSFVVKFKDQPVISEDKTRLVNHTKGEYIASPCATYTSNDASLHRKICTDLGEDSSIKTPYFRTHTPKNTPLEQFCQTLQPNIPIYNQDGLTPVCQTENPGPVSFSLHSVAAEVSSKTESQKAFPSPPKAVATSVSDLPSPSPPTDTSTHEVVDTFKNIRALRLSAPCTPPTPTPLPTPLLSACSESSRSSIDLINLDAELENFTSNEFSRAISGPSINTDGLQPCFPLGAGDWWNSCIWDDLTTLDQSFVSPAVNVEFPPTSPHGQLSIDDLLSKMFATCMSLVDKPLLDLTTAVEGDCGIETEPLTRSVPLRTKIDCAVQVSETVEKCDQDAQTVNRMEAAAQEIQEINHRLSLNIDSARPMKVHFKINKRKIGRKSGPTKTTHARRYLESRSCQPAKRMKVSISDLIPNDIHLDPVHFSHAPFISSDNDRPVLPSSSSLPSVAQADGTFEYLMPGAFPLDSNEIQYGPGLYVLLRRLVYLCFAW